MIDDIPAFLSAEPMDPGERFAVRDRDTLYRLLDEGRMRKKMVDERWQPVRLMYPELRS